MSYRNSRAEKARRRSPRPKEISRNRPVDLLETVELLHAYLEESLCETVFHRVRRAERQREWTLHTLAEFWTAVILRAPEALTQALQEAARGTGPYPKIETSEEAFFKRCKNLRWTFFAELFAEFQRRILEATPAGFAPEAAALRRHFPEVWILDGSKLDAVAHRLKILWDVRSAVLPGGILVAYDLFRGIPQRVQFDADAAAYELTRAHRILDTIPKGTLLLGDRHYGGSVALFGRLREKALWGLFRLHGHLKIRRLKRESRVPVQGGGVLEDWLVEAGTGSSAPRQTLRLVRLKRGRTWYEVLTNVMDPERLSAIQAMELYPHRWSIERMFFDLKEVLNLHRFYAANPNAVAMQVYAAVLVYTAMRVAQARIAHSMGIPPEEISTRKFFVRVAAASTIVVGARIGFAEMRRANPRHKLKTPDLRGKPYTTTTLGAILVEERAGPRRKRRFCAGRHLWKSFAHIRGARHLLN